MTNCRREREREETRASEEFQFSLTLAATKSRIVTNGRFPRCQLSDGRVSTSVEPAPMHASLLIADIGAPIVGQRACACSGITI